MPGMNELVQALQLTDVEDPQSAEKLLPGVYEELRRMAACKLPPRAGAHTLQPTALVHEAFLRLVVDPERTWTNRRHFFAAATEAMRHILVDRARRKASTWHGGGLARVDFNEIEPWAETAGEDILLVHESLERLAEHDAEAAELVRLRFFGGFTFPQAAELLGVSERTAKRTWSYARAWLFDEIQRANGVPA